MKIDILGWHKIVFVLTRLVQVSGDSLNIYIYTVEWIQKVHCQLVQKMTILTVNDYCSGESGAQPANTNPSLETKETKVGPLRDDCSSHQAPLLQQQSEVGWSAHPVIEHLPIMPRGSLSTDATALNESGPGRAGRFIFTEATAAVTLVIFLSVHVRGRIELLRLWLRIPAGDFMCTK